MLNGHGWPATEYVVKESNDLGSGLGSWGGKRAPVQHDVRLRLVAGAHARRKGCPSVLFIPLADHNATLGEGPAKRAQLTMDSGSHGIVNPTSRLLNAVAAPFVLRSRNRSEVEIRRM